MVLYIIDKKQAYNYSDNKNSKFTSICIMFDIPKMQS